MNNNSSEPSKFSIVLNVAGATTGLNGQVYDNAVSNTLIQTISEGGLTVEKLLPRNKRQIRKIEPEYISKEFGLLKLLADNKCK